MRTVNKFILSLLAMALVCCVSISGVLAWLTQQTGPVVNTFTYGDVQITLIETTTTVDDDDSDSIIPNQYLMMPGGEITKDPVVTVAGGSEACWLFVTLEVSENFDEYLAYDMADGWQALPDYDGVYYQELVDDDALQAAAQGLDIIADHTVYVKKGVTREQLQTLQDDSALWPTLTVTAYAVQREGFDEAADAWYLVNEQLV